MVHSKGDSSTLSEGKDLFWVFVNSALSYPSEISPVGVEEMNLTDVFSSLDLKFDN